MSFSINVSQLESKHINKIVSLIIINFKEAYFPSPNIGILKLKFC